MKELENLKKAVVMQAVKDYRHATHVLRRNPDNLNAQNLKRECEFFFRSEFFSLFTDVDGRYLMAKLKEEMAQ